MELDKILFSQFNEIKEVLIEKAEHLNIRLIYTEFLDSKIKKQLKSAGIKVNKFNHKQICSVSYKNMRNAIIIDGNLAFVGSIKEDEVLQKKDQANLFFKLEGELIEELDLSVRQDAIFASGKYIDYKKVPFNCISNNALVQLVTNDVDSNLELLLIKAISSAKKSIFLELKEFIPNESVMALLKFAINSNIDVRLIIPIKAKSSSTEFASRAYAKELAELGANVYLFDGNVGFNAVTIDEKYVLFGSMSLNKIDVMTSMQHIFIVDDKEIASYFIKQFNYAVNNSYRINNAKYKLFREKLFKRIM